MYVCVRRVRECGARVLCIEGNCQVAVTAGTAEGRFVLLVALKLLEASR